MRTTSMALLIAATALAGCGNPTNNGFLDFSVKADLSGGADGPKPGDGGVADLTQAADSAMSDDMAVTMDDMAMSMGDMVTLPVDLPALVDLPPLADASMPGDAAMAGDAAKPSDGGTPPDMLMVPDGHMGCAPIINELMSATTQQATEEFVEIYNPCQMDIDLTNWTLVYRSQGNVGTIDRANDTYGLFAWMNVTIPAGGYLVYGGANFPMNMRDGQLTNALAETMGAVAIRDPFGFVVDSVAYGAVNPMNAFIETAAAPAPTKAASPGNSVARLPNAMDTNNNSVDWKKTLTPTPKMANK